MSSFAENVAAVRGQIEKTCKYAMVDTANPTLIAVSKRQPQEKIDAAVAAGHRVFGENRVQEAQDHWANKDGIDGLELHLIGSLQTNKAADAVALFDVIQVVDREKLARALAREMDKQDKRPDLFIQVNTGEEPQKGGVMPDDLPALVAVCAELDLPVIGLMCIPPASDDPTLHFALLKKLAGRYGLEKLSMGMSSDYDRAAAMGASHIRVGTALFGERES